MIIGKKYDYSFKTIIVGDSGVGKTSILFRFTRNSFQDDTPSTLGVEFMSKVVESDGKSYEIQLWDTAGQELFRAVTRGYFRGSEAAFLVYDITNKDSFKNINRWLVDITSFEKNVVGVLIGNKCDISERREVSSEEAQKYANENDLLFFEASAKSGENIEKAMTSFLSKIEQLIEHKNKNDSQSILNEESTQSKDGCNC